MHSFYNTSSRSGQEGPLKDRILEAYAQCEGIMPRGKIPKFVASQLGTTHGYVRTVARQRKGRGQSEAEIRYLRSPLGRNKNRRCNRETRERIKADPVRLALYRLQDRERKRRAYWARKAEAAQ